MIAVGILRENCFAALSTASNSFSVLWPRGEKEEEEEGLEEEMEEKEEWELGEEEMEEV